ncbi:MAG: ribosome small subunit-dependent GTPase A [Actinomycetaceae bacterium]|nr:ribosome small subunit-dependent GTPase A [Actinomycetaceae bacterium]
MARRDIGTDDPRVRVRPGKGSRPRTKRRPDYSQHPAGQVMAVDRGRYRVIYEGRQLQAVKARELGRGAVVVGDRVRLTGDLSGRKDTLARIVRVEQRRSQVRRSAEDSDTKGQEKTMVANADYLVIVVALTNPPPRPGFIDRCLVAAFDGGMKPIVCITKADLGSSEQILQLAHALDVTTIVTSIDPDNPHSDGVEQLRTYLSDHVSVLIGHSGVGKSTLINALIPQAHRETGHVNEVTGRGRHTSTSVVALPLPDGGWVIDTPGVRGFGLAHVQVDHIIEAFPDLENATELCPRGCDHSAEAPECGWDQWVEEATDPQERDYRAGKVNSVRRLLLSVVNAQTPQWMQ